MITCGYRDLSFGRILELNLIWLYHPRQSLSIYRISLSKKISLTLFCCSSSSFFFVPHRCQLCHATSFLQLSYRNTAVQKFLHQRTKNINYHRGGNIEHLMSGNMNKNLSQYQLLREQAKILVTIIQNLDHLQRKQFIETLQKQSISVFSVILCSQCLTECQIMTDMSDKRRQEKMLVVYKYVNKIWDISILSTEFNYLCSELLSWYL